MAVGAYVFVNARAGGATKALEGIRKISEVKQAHLVTGLHDIIAYLETPDVNMMGNVILTKIHKIDGIDKTVTCVTVQD